MSKNVITKLFKDTTLIGDKDLAYEIYLVISLRNNIVSYLKKIKA